MAELPTHRIVKCRGCGAPMIFLPTDAGKMCPADADTVEPGDLTFDWVKHKSHFATCPEAAKFRRRK